MMIKQLPAGEYYMTQPTAFEQYLLELINRDRANPLAAANSYGIGLNDGIQDPSKIISGEAKQPLAFNFLLNDAANFHSQWMIDNDTFSHIGEGGNRANNRIENTGYEYTIWGENLSKVSSGSTTGTLLLNSSIVELVNEGLFTSSQHRVNVFNGNFREIGLATLQGDFNDRDSLLVTENFAKSGSDVFLTGVAFNDLVLDDDFYTIGEGLAEVEVTAVRQSDNQTFSTTTTASGGYQFALDPGTYEVSFEQNNQTLGSTRKITIAEANVKLDLDTSNLSQNIGEIGQISNLDHGIQTIQLDNSYTNPVVFALPLSYNGGDPAIARITDIQDDNFSLYLQEAEYKDGRHVRESVSYLVLEAGSWELEDGTLLEVGTLDSNGTTTSFWSGIDFDSDFEATPAILSQVQTDNDGEFVRTRQKSSSVDGFELTMEEEDALKSSGHSAETIGWLAIESGRGSWDGLDYQVGHTGDTIDHTWNTVDFELSFGQAPNLLASIASFRGGDPVGLRYRNLGTGNVQIKAEEDQSLDSEILHVSESVDFLAIAGSGSLSASPYDPMTSF